MDRSAELKRTREAMLGEWQQDLWEPFAEGSRPLHEEIPVAPLWQPPGQENSGGEVAWADVPGKRLADSELEGGSAWKKLHAQTHSAATAVKRKGSFSVLSMRNAHAPDDASPPTSPEDPSAGCWKRSKPIYWNDDANSGSNGFVGPWSDVSSFHSGDKRSWVDSLSPIEELATKRPTLGKSSSDSFSPCKTVAVCGPQRREDIARELAERLKSGSVWLVGQAALQKVPPSLPSNTGEYDGRMVVWRPPSAVLERKPPLAPLMLEDVPRVEILDDDYEDELIQPPARHAFGSADSVDIYDDYDFYNEDDAGDCRPMDLGDD